MPDKIAPPLNTPLARKRLEAEIKQHELAFDKLEIRLMELEEERAKILESQANVKTNIDKTRDQLNSLEG